jgi:HSP20 family protein
VDSLRNELNRAFGPFAWHFWQPPQAFPPVNVYDAEKEVRVVAEAPGIDPAKLEVSIDKGLLTITGERVNDLPGESEKVAIYGDERFGGPFKRVISLPEDVDASRVEAKYRDGILRIAVPKLEESKPRRIEVAAA